MFGGGQISPSNGADLTHAFVDDDVGVSACLADAVPTNVSSLDEQDLPGMAEESQAGQRVAKGAAPALYSPREITQTQTLSSEEPHEGHRPTEVPWQQRREFKRVSSVDSMVRPLSKRDWRRDRESVDFELARIRTFIAIAGLLGAFFAVIQNEFILVGEDPLSGTLNSLKLCNMMCSICYLVLLVRYYMLWELFDRIRMHLLALHPLDIEVSISSVCHNRWFWAEVFVFGIFLPPYCSFEYVTTNWNNVVMYRAETIFAVMNSLRVFLLWPLLKNHMLVSLPRRHTISAFCNIEMGSAFAFKIILNNEARALRFIGCVWALSFILCGFWFRAAENTACLVPSADTTTAKSPECFTRNARFWSLVADVSDITPEDQFEKINDIYMWNALWAIFITSTSVGYGDISPTTHLGRFICFISALSGLICGATLTATLAVLLQWTADETSAMLLVRREHAKRDLRKYSERMILNWIRSLLRDRKFKGVGTIVRPPQTRRQMRESFEQRQLFRRAKLATMVTFDDCRADIHKFDTIFHSTRYVFEAMVEVEHKVNEVLSKDNVLPFGKTQLESVPESIRDVLTSLTSSPDAHVPPLEQAESSLISQALSRRSSIASMKRFMWREAESNAHIITAEENIRDSAEEERNRTTKALADAMAIAAEGPKDLLSLMQIAKHRTSSGRLAFVKPTPDWRRNRLELARREAQISFVAAFFGVGGTLCAVIQNEWVYSNRDPNSVPCNIFKIINSIFTGVLLICLYRAYCMSILITRLRKHLSHGKTFDPEILFSDVLFHGKFLAEVAICFLHVPPFCSGEIPTSTLDNIVVYSYETAGCCMNLTRLYLLWRPFQRWMISDIPNRQNIAGLSNTKFESLFVMKRMVNSWNSFLYVACAWTCAIILFGYLFRIAEVSSCGLDFSAHPDCLLPRAQTWIIYGSSFEKSNDLALWNGMWLVFVTMTTVGYGDSVPSTHAGRLVCALATLVGITLASLMTAALANLMTFNSSEQGALAVVKREQSRMKLRNKAATVLQLWWKRVKKLQLTKSQEDVDRHMLRREFLELKLDTMQEVEDLQDMSHKIDKVSRRIKMIEDKIGVIASTLWSKDTLQEMSKGWANTAIGDLGSSFKGKSSTSLHVPAGADEETSGHRVTFWSSSDQLNDICAADDDETVRVLGASFGLKDEAAAHTHAHSYDPEIDSTYDHTPKCVLGGMGGRTTMSAHGDFSQRTPARLSDENLARNFFDGNSERRHINQEAMVNNEMQGRGETELVRLLQDCDVNDEAVTRILSIFHASRNSSTPITLSRNASSVRGKD